MYKKLDLKNWKRKEHFKFFKDFDEPFFGLTVDIDCTIAYTICKSEGYSFFLYYLHKSLKAVNNIVNFRYRIENDEVLIFDKVNASTTINRPQGTFGFAHIEYWENYLEFQDNAKQKILQVQKSTSLTPAIASENVIHYSSVPWIKFTSLSHARNFSFKDSSPKIAFGQMTLNGKNREMPMSIHVHHALMDGFHVAQYIEEFQQLMNSSIQKNSTH